MLSDEYLPNNFKTSFRLAYFHILKKTPYLQSSKAPLLISSINRNTSITDNITGSHFTDARAFNYFTVLTTKLVSNLHVQHYKSSSEVQFSTYMKLTNNDIVKFMVLASKIYQVFNNPEKNSTLSDLTDSDILNLALLITYKYSVDDGYDQLAVNLFLGIVFPGISLDIASSKRGLEQLISKEVRVLMALNWDIHASHSELLEMSSMLFPGHEFDFEGPLAFEGSLTKSALKSGTRSESPLSYSSASSRASPVSPITAEPCDTTTASSSSSQGDTPRSSGLFRSFRSLRISVPDNIPNTTPEERTAKTAKRI